MTVYSDIIIVTNLLKRSADLADTDIRTAFGGIRHDMPITKTTIIVGPESFSMTPKAPDEQQYVGKDNDRIEIKIRIRIYAPKNEKGENLARVFEKVANTIRRGNVFATEITCGKLEFSTALAAVCLPCTTTLSFLRSL